jgi:hypothetical protein
MLADLLVVGALTTVGGVVLGILAAILFLRIAIGGREQEDRAGFVSVARLAFRSSFGCLGAFVLFVTVVTAWGGLAGRFSGDPPPRASHDAVPAEVTEMLEQMRSDRERLEGSEITGIVPTLPGDTTSPQAPGGTPQAESGPPSARSGWASGIRASLRALAEDLGLGFGWGALYFTFWLTLWRGRTPGKRLLGLRVVRLDGRPIGWWNAFERYGGYAAGFATGLLGFAQVYWDANRQASHDKIASTVVILDGRPPLENGPEGGDPR